jgi:DNA-binding NarL/FixJ family response regulator
VGATARRPLSTEQREALTLLCAGHSLEAIAERLGISPKAARRRLSRCVGRVSGGPSALAAEAAPRSPRAWAEAPLARSGAALDPATVALLRAFAEGASHRSLAAQRDITVGALRQRLRRLKQRLSGGPP